MWYREIKRVFTQKMSAYIKSEYRAPLLALFFALCMVLGKSYLQSDSWDSCFGDWNKISGFFAAVFLWMIVFCVMLRWAGKTMKSLEMLKQNPKSLTMRFLGKHTMIKILCIILVCWTPFIILCYPGGYCVDVCYQIAQVLGEASYSTQQPLAHTLLVGGFVKYGEMLTGSYNKGLYLYILFQAVVLAFAFAYSLNVLYKKGVSEKLLLMGIGIYGFVPMFSNFATMAIKDTLFNACVVLYVVGLMQLDDIYSNWRKKLFFIICTIGVMLFRNNGIYIVCFSGIVMLVSLWKKETFRRKLILGGHVLVVPLIIYFAVSSGIATMTNAQNVGSREMLSVFFQQTARYAKEYGDEITVSERADIEAILGECEKIAEIYDPNISDPVKSRFNVSATNEELVNYFRTWVVQFMKHPDSYVQSFFNGVYGWFYPGAVNSIRYTAESPLFWRPGAMQKVESTLNSYYAAWDRIPVLGLLENAAFYTWVLLFLCSYVWKVKKRREIYLLAPGVISLFICMASPAFYMHIRYAFPIMFPMPILFMYYSLGDRMIKQDRRI